LAATALLAGILMPATLVAQDEGGDPAPAAAPAPHREYDSIATPKAPIRKSEARRAAEAALFSERQTACESGSASACGELGEAYELGIGAPQNRPVAAILYAEACEAGDAAGCHRLGRLRLALEDRSAQAAAFPAFDRACELGSLDGCGALARAYRSGIGVAQDAAIADRLARETCERGGAEACIDHAEAIRRSDPENLRAAEVAALLERACDGGAVYGCTQLAYEARWGTPQPFTASERELLERACDLEDAVSCELLGALLYRGDGSYVDPQAAMPFFERACYLDPDHLCQSAGDLRAEPVEYAACQNDDASACARLAEIYARPNSPLHDPALSQAYFEYACYAWATEACTWAGALVLNSGSDPDAATIEQGIAYLERGCAADELASCRQLAGHLVEGRILARDEARFWQLAARLCEGGGTDYCERLEQAYPENPDLPLVEAGIEYIPPIEEGDTDWREPFLSEAEREEEANRCAASAVEFRGKVLKDEVCDPRQLVIGGFKVKPGAAPWQALIWRPERAFGVDLYPQERVLCGGSLIATGWILTAAHCLRDDGGWITGRGYTVRLGVNNPRADEGVTYPITQIHRHPQYNSRNFAFDIALVQYDARRGQPGAFSHAIRSIAIDRKSMSERPIVRGQPTYVYGWGWTAASASSSTADLLAAKLLLESQAQCNALSGLPRSQWNTKLCAAGDNREQACKGDSGGPLITYEDADRRPRVIGVVSSGNSCGQTGKASRYIRVSAALDWIVATMGR
jgi:TPR repeat protein